MAFAESTTFVLRASSTRTRSARITRTTRPGTRARFRRGSPPRTGQGAGSRVLLCLCCSCATHLLAESEDHHAGVERVERAQDPEVSAGSGVLDGVHESSLLSSVSASGTHTYACDSARSRSRVTTSLRSTAVSSWRKARAMLVASRLAA